MLPNNRDPVGCLQSFRYLGNHGGFKPEVGRNKSAEFHKISSGVTLFANAFVIGFFGINKRTHENGIIKKLGRQADNSVIASKLGIHEGLKADNYHEPKVLILVYLKLKNPETDMHELSIAMGIVKIAEDELSKSAADRIDEIELDIGQLSGIEMSSFEFVWPSAIENTVLQNSKRKINNIKGKAVCLDCNAKFDLMNQFDNCPECKSMLKEIVQGQELRVKSLLVS